MLHTGHFETCILYRGDCYIIKEITKFKGQASLDVLPDLEYRIRSLFLCTFNVHFFPYFLMGQTHPIIFLPKYMLVL